MTRVAVTSRSFSRHPVLREALLTRYPDTSFNDEGLSLRGNALIDFLRGHERAITALEPLDASVFKAVPELKVIGKYGVGFDMVNLRDMIDYGIALGWTGGVNKRSVSELVIAFAISLLRAIPQTNQEVRHGTWKQAVGKQLSDATVGIVGCGHVGQDLGRALRYGFGCRVLVHDILPHDLFCQEVGAGQTPLDDLLAAADIVSLHLPLDQSTQNLFNRKRLSDMKRGALLINTARGGLVDETALFDCLVSGHLAGAAFDVFVEEPPQNRDLIELPNFIATPHIGGSAEEAILAMGRAAIDGLDNHRIPKPGVFPPGVW